MSMLNEFSHKNIDELNGHQLRDFGTAVGRAATDILSVEGVDEMNAMNLIDRLRAGALGRSEIAFGLVMAAEYGLLSMFWYRNEKYYRIPEGTVSNSPQGEERLVIYANSNVSRGKFAAAAVHAALNHYGINHGAVIVLGSKAPDIELLCDDVVHDAGRTEVEPGTVTAGVFEHKNRPNPQERLDVLRRRLETAVRVADASDTYLSTEAIMAIIEESI